MSGSSALAAAKRRRAKNDVNANQHKEVSKNVSKPSLTVSESIIYLNNRLSNLEKRFQTSDFSQNNKSESKSTFSHCVK